MKYWSIIFLCCLTISALGTEPSGNIYWVQFNTKAGTPFSFEKPEEYLSEQAFARRTKHHIEIDSTDLPVNPAFTDSLQSLGFYIKHTSRWMNGAIVIWTDSITPAENLKLPSFVSFIELRKGIPLKSISNKLDDSDSLSESFYGNSTDQITLLNGHLLHKYSKGKGVTIGVIDAGFLNANKLDAFDSLYARNGVLGTRDFVSPGNNVYNTHSHGTSVLSTMATNVPGVFVGTAPDASYWLLRSEDAPTEYPVEEDYWVIAAEFADSVGCDVINSSLGYSVFDDSSFDHTYGQFTGDSLRISKAANLAVKKGIVVVCSAGNDGDKPWYYVSAPGEARDILTIAAVNNAGEIASFSSRGFSDPNHALKPDVAAIGSGSSIVSAYGEYVKGSGTSFSSPIMAGMAACLVGLFPDSSACSIISMIRQAGNLYPEHTMDYGYGIPDFGIYLPVNQEDTTKVSAIFPANIQTVYPNPFSKYIILNSPEEVRQFELYTFDGQKVYSTISKEPFLTGKISDGISELPKGLYIARIVGNTRVQTFKLIKK